MMYINRKFLLVIPIALLVFISGCVQLPDIFGPGGKSEVNDIVTIREGIKAVPSPVAKGQSVKITVPIQNNLPATETQVIPVNVRMTNWCSPAFTPLDVECPEGSSKVSPGAESFGCDNVEMGPQRTKTINFDLKSGDIAHKCEVKVELDYPFESQSVTDIKFINFEDMQRQQSEGRFKPFASKEEKGKGPVKVFFHINGEQPIPTEDSSEYRPTARLKIENAGTGSVKDSAINLVSFEVAAPDLLRCKDDKNKDISTGSVSIKDVNEFVCDVKIPSHTELPGEKEYLLILNSDYFYKVGKTVSIEIV